MFTKLKAYFSFSAVKNYLSTPQDHFTETHLFPIPAACSSKKMICDRGMAKQDSYGKRMEKEVQKLQWDSEQKSLICEHLAEHFVGQAQT